MPIQPVSFAQFKRSAALGRYVPFVKRVDVFEDPLKIYRCLRDGRSPSVLLESARISQKTGRYSFIAKNPFLIMEAMGSRISLSSFGQKEVLRGDPFQILRRILDQYASEPKPGCPPFTGGAIGYFGYEAKNYVEPTLTRRVKEGAMLPDIYLLFFDEGLALDHEAQALYFFVNVQAGKNLTQSYRYGSERLARLERDFKKKWNDADYAGHVSQGVHGREGGRFLFQNRMVGLERFRPLLDSSLTGGEFIEKVDRIQRVIREGEIFQANLSQRFSFPLDEDPLEVYEKLRVVNPSPFFGYLDALDFQILSGSPERLIKLEDRRLETRPIAGTRMRGKNKKADDALSMDLILSPKERAEHIMLVDLGRNDMGRVAEYGSVSVDEMMVIENYSHVKHIVSNIRGVLRHGLDAVDAFKAFFPGGTITGAPKIRCMEILDELEPIERGPYTGSLGYFSFTGNMDFNIIIRSLIAKEGIGFMYAGAGIVADSVPQKEYEETLYKAEGLLTAVFGEAQIRSFFARCGVASRAS